MTDNRRVCPQSIVHSPQIVDQRGAVLIFTFIIMAALTVIVGSFLLMTSIQTKAGGYDIASHKALWLAEAGLQKAVWNLKTPPGGGGQGEDWTTAGTTESLGDGSYTMVVERWDFALADNGSSASATSESGSQAAANAIDGDDATYWQSAVKPTPDDPDKPPQEIIITFPYTLTINKVRFLVPSGSSQQSPKDYTWQVSSDGSSYTVAVDTQNSNSDDVTDTFTAASNVNYLKLRVTKIRGGSIGVRIATLEAIGADVTSTGSVGVLNRKIERTVIADDATETANDEIDWTEIVPAV